MKPARLVVCGPAKRMTRDEIMAEDAAFLQKMQGDHLAAKTSVELVREGRRVSSW